MPEISIKKNFAYKSALTISTYLMNFITFPYVSRVLGVDGIGLVSFVDNAINYFLLFSTMGIGLIGVREIAAVRNDKDKCNQTFSNMLGLNLIFTLATLVVYLVCIFLIPQFNQYKELFYIGTAKILFTAFLLEWFFTGLENFRYITLRSLLIKLLYVIAVFIWIRSREDYELYFVLTVAVVVINALINMIYVRQFVRLQISAFLSTKYIKQNLYIGFCSIMSSMYITFNVVFLGMVSTNVEVGYYTTAFKLYSVILGFISAFTGVMLPRMSSLLSTGEKERFQHLLNKSFEVMSIFSIPLILCSIILAPQIIYVLSGNGYEGAILPMQIIMPAVLFVGIAQVLAIQVLLPMKKDKVVLIASIIGAFVALVTNLMITPILLSVGTSIVLLCSEFVVTASYIAYFLHQKIASIPYRKLINSFLCSLPCAIICWGCSHFVYNDFLVLLLSFLLSGLCFLLIQIKMNTCVGDMALKFLPNMNKNKIK